jgi:hypothetical protein
MARSEESEPALILPEAFIFIMLGAFLTAAGGFWFSYQSAQPFSSRGVYSVCVGLMCMGIALIVIGMGVGRMALRNRSAARDDPRLDEDRPLDRKQ